MDTLIGIAVLGYTVDENNVIQNLLVLKESENYTILTEEIKKSEKSFLNVAIQKLKALTSVEIADQLKWSWLEEMTEKFSDNTLYCFAVDLSGKEITGTSEEYAFVPVQEALKTTDAFLQAMFFRLFMKVYKKDLAH